MLPEVIIHNSVTLDNAFTAYAYNGFEIDICLHYEILLSFKPDAVLTGSGSALRGVEMSGSLFVPEEEADFKKPVIDSGDIRPFSILVDSKGHLKDKLHFYRRLEHIKDVIVVISQKTPPEYVSYLKERDYDFIIAGEDKADLKEALSQIKKRYGFLRIVSDSGSLLNGVLLNAGVADTLSLLVYPVIAGKEERKLFEYVKKSLTLKLIKSGPVSGGIVHQVYKTG